jgi:transcriptional regulator with XRE-family HTH domain
MRGIGQAMTVGERVAWYRRRRGMPQEVLAGLVSRTTDWLSKIENNRIELDRVSVVRSLASALDVTVGDLLGEPSLMDAAPSTGASTIPALREALLDYRQLSPFGTGLAGDPSPLPELKEQVRQVWRAYQDSRYGLAVHTLPGLVSSAQSAIHAYTGDDLLEAHKLLALTYQVSSVLLTKLGEADLAWVAAERGFHSAQQSGDLIIQGSVVRAIIHALQSTGRYGDAKRLTTDATGFLQDGLHRPSPEFLSVYGTVFLAGSIAAARDDDRAAVRTFLNEADELAHRLGQDANHLWTSFGPTNVAIHRVTTAMDLGDVQVAIDLGQTVNPEGLPAERQARHAMELARALSAWNRPDEALSCLLEAERIAPEQVRYHAISRQLVQGWIQRGRSKPSYALSQLAKRVHVDK